MERYFVCTLTVKCAELLTCVCILLPESVAYLCALKDLALPDHYMGVLVVLCARYSLLLVCLKAQSKWELLLTRDRGASANLIGTRWEKGVVGVVRRKRGCFCLSACSEAHCSRSRCLAGGLSQGIWDISVAIAQVEQKQRKWVIQPVKYSSA